MIIDIQDDVNGIIGDCWLYPGGYADMNMGLYISGGGWTGTNEVRPVIMKVDLTGFSNIDVISSSFNLYPTASGGATHTIRIDQVKKVWNEGTGTSSGHVTLDGEVTYNSARHNEELWETPGALGSSDVNILSTTPSFPTTNPYVMTVPTTLTRQWVDGDVINQGIVVREMEAGSYLSWWSCENPTAGYRPKFHLEYTEIVPVYGVPRNKIVNFGGV